MNNSSLKSYLASHLFIDEKALMEIIDNCTVREVKKDEFLLQVNHYCKHTFFVEKGLLKQFAIDKKGKEHLLSFAPENWFVTDRDSAYFNRPSRYFIQAQEDSRVVMIDEKFIHSLSEKMPSFNDFNNRLLHSHIRQQQERIHLLLSATAEERYLHFIKIYPDILLRVPQTMIASYLGITPESLSRVRKELTRKNTK